MRSLRPKEAYEKYLQLEINILHYWQLILSLTFREQKSQNPLSEWILMEAPNRYYIDRDNFEVFQFLRMSKYEPRVAMDHFVLELEFYGIVRNQHYTIEPKSQFEPSPVFRWNENYNVS